MPLSINFVVRIDLIYYLYYDFNNTFSKLNRLELAKLQVVLFIY